MSTVSITYFDRDGVRRAVDAHIRALVARHPELEEAYLFGSLAQGTPVPGSDVDLLLVLSHSDLPFLQRIPAFLPGAFPAPMDVFPYTRGELERMKAEGNRFVLDALLNGVNLFRRADAAPAHRLPPAGRP